MHSDMPTRPDQRLIALYVGKYGRSRRYPMRAGATTADVPTSIRTEDGAVLVLTMIHHVPTAVAS